jgi:hypothetical protein
MFLGRIIDEIIHRTPLQGLVNTVSEKIEKAFGVSELKNKVLAVLESSLESLLAPLQSIVAKTESMTSTFEAVSCPIPKMTG